MNRTSPVKPFETGGGSGSLSERLAAKAAMQGIFFFLLGSKTGRRRRERKYGWGVNIKSGDER